MLKQYNSAEFKNLSPADQAYVANLLDAGHESIVGFMASQQFKDLCDKNWNVAIAITVESALADYVNLKPMFTQAISPSLLQNINMIAAAPPIPQTQIQQQIPQIQQQIPQIQQQIPQIQQQIPQIQKQIPQIQQISQTDQAPSNKNLYWIAGGAIAVVALFLLMGREHDRGVQSNPDDDFCDIDTDGTCLVHNGSVESCAAYPDGHVRYEE